MKISVILTVILLSSIAMVCGEDGNLFGEKAKSQTPVLIEFRLAETSPGPGLVAAHDPKSSNMWSFIYLHQDPIVNNHDIRNARVTKDPIFDKYQIVVTLNGPSSLRFQTFTGKNIGKTIAIIIEGNAVNTVLIQVPISSGVCIVDGNFTRVEAERIASGLMISDKPKSTIK